MDTDKFKNDLMIGETSSIEFKSGSKWHVLW